MLATLNLNIQEVLFGMDDTIPSPRIEKDRRQPGINSYIYEHEIILRIIPGLGTNLDSFQHSSNSEIQFMISILKTPSVAYLQCYKALSV